VPRLRLVPSTAAAMGAAQLCPRCGGSGVLRTNAFGFRTCLDCVGQGALARLELARALEPPLRFHRRSTPLPEPVQFSAWLSSGAR